MTHTDTPKKSALFLSAFFDELIRCGVQDVVVSPGSRSTPLALLAHESDLRLHVAIDERGAGFFALGLAKASGLPTCVICTSGTAVANYYPAVLEAQASRVPLILLTGDRPPRLQNLGAPQTCDQLNMFGNHVRHFQQISLPGASKEETAYARQMALVAFSKSVGVQASEDDEGNPWYGAISDAGPVHLNFPFEEPLMPDLYVEGLFDQGRKESHATTPLMATTIYPDAQTIDIVKELLQNKRCIVLCGEGSCVNTAEAELLLAWARRYQLPLLADPLSNLRSYDEALVIDNYDNLFSDEACTKIDLVIRFGRYPVSKACFTTLAEKAPMQVVVDCAETRDFNAATDLFIRCTPAAFVASFLYEAADIPLSDEERASYDRLPASDMQQAFARTWIERNEVARKKIEGVKEVDHGFEGAFIYRLMELIPADTCIFSASSLSIRMIDTFYLKQDKRVTVLCNRGLNGIDGSISSALGASLRFEQTILVTGDLAALHDINALALHHELTRNAEDGSAPAIIIMVMNNKGGGIFEMLPQQSEKPYFKRLFLTPQDIDFSQIAAGFGIPYECAKTVAEMEQAFEKFANKPGIHLIEVPVAREGLKDRYGDFLA